MSDWIPDNIDLHVARQIRQVRKKRKITAQKMAHYLNISESVLRQIELASRPLSAGLLFHIISILGCDLQDIFPNALSFQDPIKIQQKKIADFCTFADELIHNYLMHGPDDIGS